MQVLPLGLVISGILLLAWALFFLALGQVDAWLKILGCVAGGYRLLQRFRFSQFSGNMVPIFELALGQARPANHGIQPTDKPTGQPEAHR